MQKGHTVDVSHLACGQQLIWNDENRPSITEATQSTNTIFCFRDYKQIQANMQTRITKTHSKQNKEILNFTND